jgi:hypothetical protein
MARPLRTAANVFGILQILLFTVHLLFVLVLELARVTGISGHSALAQGITKINYRERGVMHCNECASSGAIGAMRATGPMMAIENLLICLLILPCRFCGLIKEVF